jgi:ketol-acid reductoisomerase
MAGIYYDADVSLEPLRDKTIAVIGYGSRAGSSSEYEKLRCECHIGLTG